MIFKSALNNSYNESELNFFANKYKLNKDVVKVLFSRGIDSLEKLDKYINTENYPFHNPFLLKNMQEVVEKIKQAINLNKKILIYGDYDVDGVSASAILILYFNSLGKEVSSFLPNRYKDGYGITKETVDKIIAKDKPDLIITVDCGISCYEEVEYIKSNGIDIIVTDHHEIPDVIPNCLIINPKLKDQEYPFRELCGTGVAFKIVQALAGELEAEQYLPICAIATIADIVPLLDENRLIVKKGLKLFSKLPIGIRMLIKQLKMSTPISSTDIAFKLSPKINASGRMGDASESLNLYLETNVLKIKNTINNIINYNTERQVLCNQVYDDCKQKLANLDVPSLGVIILKSDNWDSGILGIVCARLVDEYNKPVILFAKEGDFYKGSARSISTINIHEVLNNNKDIISSFGGHSMAAGIELKLNCFTEFMYRINSYVLENIDNKLLLPIKYYDLELDEKKLNLNYIKEFEVMQPFGCDNPKPNFLLTFNKCNVSTMKNFKNHLNIQIGKNKIVAFNALNYYDVLNIDVSKQAIVDIFIEKFNKRDLLKINLKHLKVNSLSPKNELIDRNIYYLHQLRYINADLKAYYKYFEISEINSLTNQLKQTNEDFGVLFIANSRSALNLLKEVNINIHSYFINTITDSYGLNSILIAPTGVDNFRFYKKIVFLDPILTKNYLGYIQSLGNIEVFIPSNLPFDKKLFFQINSTRNNMINLFNFIKSNLTKDEFITISSLLLKYRSNLKNSLLNLYFALIVFEELSIITFEKLDYTYKITVNNDVKTNLKNSKVYNYINFIKSTL